MEETIVIDYDKRLERLREAMGRWGVDYLFLAPDVDWIYYSGLPVHPILGAIRVPGD